MSGQSPYVKKFISGSFQGLNLYGCDFQDVCEYVADKKERFLIGYYEVNHYVLPSCPLDDTIKTAFQEENEIINVFENLFGRKYSAWIVWAERIIKMSPTTYVGFLYQDEDLLYYYRNTNSEITLNYESKTSLLELCSIFDYTYKIVSLENDISFILLSEPIYIMPLEKEYCCDSKVLIKTMLREIYIDEKSISEASYRINGIIGSALSHKSDMSKEKVYNILQKKLRRIDLIHFVEDERFNEFVLAKAFEKGI